MNPNLRQQAGHRLLVEILPATVPVSFNRLGHAVAKLDDVAEIGLVPNQEGAGADDGFYVELVVNDLHMDGWPVSDPRNIRAALRSLVQSLADRYRGEALVAVKRLTRSDLAQDLMVTQARQAAQRLVGAETLAARL